ncbi:MAG TPA: heavy metal-associated domain-containing protein [Kofleriaceae bacterium]
MHTTLAVSGMTCNGCVRHVDKALREIAGVTGVTVSLPGTAEVDHAEAAQVAQLLQAVEAAGYTATEK